MDPIHALQSGTPAPLNKLIGEEEVARLLGVSRRHVTNLRKRRVIPFYLLGRAVRFSPEAIADALKRQLVEARQ